MRVLLLMLLVAFAANARAQEQENRLIDRLLRPNLALQNPAQSKHFVAAGHSIDKKAETNSFYIANVPATKKFTASRKVSGGSYSSQSFSEASVNAYVENRNELSKSADTSTRTETLKPAAAQGSGWKINATKFAGNRPFLDQGKSQKALSQHNTPLTIEQVRELLNKNK